MLRIRDEYCHFPGGNGKACSSNVDHIKKFDSGGTTIFGNLYSLCDVTTFSSTSRTIRLLTASIAAISFPNAAA
ncbi:HNH endonuclease [Arthrobacter alpinus]|uniref:HNH endonuclease n=1 Tax=Arthrobacter alpinus TaxID=656366 RepID=UPI000ACC2106|nr:HNH endonuclease signature motif containing protein [Arthrobacter alpinus]